MRAPFQSKETSEQSKDHCLRQQMARDDGLLGLQNKGNKNAGKWGRKRPKLNTPRWHNLLRDEGKH